jgi:oxygen-independent coproporphyrinogen-3 oxidase
MHISKKLLEKYNIAVPRYTSYPPANHFTGDISSSRYMELLEASNSWEPRHMALYVHIPFCKKICFYCGCNACTMKNDEQVQHYLAALHTEIRKVSKLLDPARTVTQVHFGGGTPNVLPAEKLKRLMDLFRSEFHFAPDPEIAIELNPAYLDEAYVRELLESGFNRFSLGIQDFNTDVLSNVNREPSALPVDTLVQMFRSGSEKAAVNLDFIYGLPGQTPDSFQKTLEQAISMQPDRLVTFAYAHVPWLKRHQQILEKKGLPGPSQRTDLYLRGYELLTGSGYRSVGLDHFVKPGDELYTALNKRKLHRNFQGYCTRETTGQVYAFGTSAISQLERAYIQNDRSVDRYITSLQSGLLVPEKVLRLQDDQIITREVITRIMCNKHIEWKDTARFLGVSPEKLMNTIRYDRAALDAMKKDGLLEYTDQELSVTELGSFLIRNIAAAFDPEFTPQEKKYSKSVG